jgi:hypothetical protein
MLAAGCTLQTNGVAASSLGQAQPLAVTNHHADLSLSLMGACAQPTLPLHPTPLFLLHPTPPLLLHPTSPLLLDTMCL